MLIFLIFVSKVLASLLIPLNENAANCGKYCANCFEDNMCTECTQGRVLVLKDLYSENGVCVKVPDLHCSFISPHKCYLCYGDEEGEGCCGVGCKFCSNNNVCKICEDGYNLEASDTGGSICRSICSHGVPSTSGECLPCHGSCESCSRPYDDNSCLLCYDGRALERSTGRCLCPSGMAEDVKTGECRDCDSTCEECIEPGDHTKCSECGSGLYLYHGSCVDSCPDRVFANDNTRRCDFYRTRGLNTCPPFCESCEEVSGYVECTRCVENYYLSLSNKRCVQYDEFNQLSHINANTLNQCSPYCRTCASSEDGNQCLTCEIGRALQRSNVDPNVGSCVTHCPTGTRSLPRSDDYGNECGNCHSSCQECSAANSDTSCTLCHSTGNDKRYLHNNQCVSDCPVTYGTSPSDNKCKRCDFPCYDCTMFHRCIDCVAGYVLRGNNNCDCGGIGTYTGPAPDKLCFPCHLYCLKCDGPDADSDCTECKSGFYKFSHRNECTKCEDPNHVKDESGHICYFCDPSCRSCQVRNNPNRCTSCVNGKVLQGETVGSCGDYCKEGTAVADYYAHYGKHCPPCHDNCKTCTVPNSKIHCTSCYPNKTPQRYLLPTTEPTKCALKCPYGYGGDANTATCVPCEFPCKDCTTPKVCTACYENYVIFGNTCICPNIGFYREPVPGPLIYEECKPCHKYCKKCTNSNPETDCSECNPDYFKGPTPGRCSECPLPNIKDSVKMLCLECHPSCKTCRTPSNEFECTSCFPDSNKAIARDTVGPCIYDSSCPVGTAVGKSSDFKPLVSRCLPCHSTCFTCTEPYLPDKCLECIGGGNANQDGTCTYCPLGQIPDPSYPTGCKDTISTPCTGIYLRVLTGVCVPFCAPNEFKDDGAMKCYPCHYLCKTCIEPYDDSKCTSCYGLLNLLLFGPEVGKCIDLCPSGTIEIEGKCHLCSPSCKTCGPTINQCITCRSDLYTLESPSISCLLKCPSGYYADTDNKCQTCNIVCKECMDGSDKCIECAAEYDFNADSRCIRCVDGTAYSITEKKCLPCHFTCGKCSVPRSNNHCITCASGLVLSGTTCLSTCPDGYYLNLPDCSSCDPTCLTCIGTHDSCLQCAIASDGKQLLKILPAPNENKDPKTVPGTCVQSCPSNRYLNPQKTACLDSCPSNTYIDRFKCLACDSSCLECLLPEDPLACTVCKRYLRVNTLTFNQTLSQLNGGVLYGQCVDICSSKDIKDDNICYAYKDREESYMKEIEFMRGRIAGVISDSLVATAMGLSWLITVIGAKGDLSSPVSLASSVQIMEMFYLVNVKNPPYNYFGYLNSMSAVTFAFLPNIPSSFLSSNTVMENREDNVIQRPFLYHRYLKAKAFITNIGNVVSYYIIVGIYIFFCLIFKRKSQLFSNKFEGILHIIIQSVILHFNQTMLSSWLHLKYMYNKLEGYYIASTITAVLALLGNLIFIAFAIKSVNNLDLYYYETFSTRFGKIYSNNRHKLSRYVIVGSLIRRSLVTFCLVFFTDYPLIQFASLLILTTATLPAIIFFRPYKIRNEYFNSIIGEVGSLILLTGSCSLHYFQDISTEVRNSIGIAIVYTITFGTTVMAIGLLYETAKNVVAFIKDMKISQSTNVILTDTTQTY